MQKARWILQSCLFIIFITGCGRLGVRESALRSRNRIIEKNVFSATGKLITIKKDGKRYGCTAFAYKRSNYVYRFITAAHCVASDDRENKKIKILSKSLIIYIENKSSKKYKARVVAVGYKGINDDLAILEAKLDRHIPILALAEDKISHWQSYVNVSYPTSADGNLFYGYVDQLNYDGSEDILLKIIGVYDPRGASGSAIVDFYSGKVIAILVAMRADRQRVIAIPISRFKRFEAKIMNGTYKYSISK